MLTSLDDTYLTELRSETLGALRLAIGDARDVALLDVPNQRNVGDSLILAGEIAYLERLGLRVRYVADMWSYRAEKLRALLPSGVVLLHGGGNFGDLWLGHQEHRERIVQDLADRRIVQLPQSLYFQSEDRARLANTIVGAHPDFVLLLRDSLSMRRAAAQLPDVRSEFCYDMALGWEGSVRRVTRPDSDRAVIIARADREGSSGLVDLPSDWLPGMRADRVDWHNSGLLALRWRLMRGAAGLYRRYVRAHRLLPTVADGPLNRLFWLVLRHLNMLNIAGGVELYGSCRLVVADRLHAHVLAVLLGIDHVLLDNSYGKVRTIYDDYTGGFSTAHYAAGLAEARELAVALESR